MFPLINKIRIPLLSVSLALIFSLCLYFFMGQWRLVFFSPHISSADTRHFVHLLEHPEEMKLRLLDKIEAHPHDALAWRLLANCYHKLGDAESAHFAAHKAMQLQTVPIVP